jgi:MFS family permease
MLFGLSAIVFIGVADPHNVTASTGSLLLDAWQGLRYTLRNPTLRALGISLAIINLGWGIVTIVVPVLVLGGLGLGEAVVGAVWAVSAITGAVGALLAGRWRTQGRERAMLALPMLGVALATAGLLVSPTLAMLVAVMAVTGFLNGPIDVALFTLRQRRTDPAWMGRAFAVSMSLNFLGYPIGAAIGGALVGDGAALPIAIAVAASVLGALVAWWRIPHSPAQADATSAAA